MLLLNGHILTKQNYTKAYTHTRSHIRYKYKNGYSRSLLLVLTILLYDGAVYYINKIYKKQKIFMFLYYTDRLVYAYKQQQQY